jgi:hypothetical protein
LGTVTASSWVMLGGRRTAGVGNTLFQSGVSVGDFCAGDARNVTNVTNTFEMGRQSDNQYPLDGSVSLALIFNRALSDDEAAALTASIKPATAPSLIQGTTVSVTTSAVSDSYSTPKNELLSVEVPGVLTNDTGTGITATLVSSATHGNVVLNANGSFIYIPETDFAGTDIFTYAATNGTEYNTAATVTINVVADNGTDNGTDNDTCSLTITPIKKFLSIVIPFRMITLSVAAGTDFPLDEDINWGTTAIRTLQIKETAAGNTVKAFVILRPFQLTRGAYNVSVGTCEGALEVQ